jgi:hypothetical protein
MTIDPAHYPYRVIASDWPMTVFIKHEPSGRSFKVTMPVKFVSMNLRCPARWFSDYPIEDISHMTFTSNGLIPTATLREQGLIKGVV